MKSPIQRILFGSPGTGKSHRIKDDIIPNDLGIKESETPENIIRTVFHPEYTYGDFIGKLLPLTSSGKALSITISTEGHFLKALAQSYRNILIAKDTENPKNVALVIDEINRGNSSAIFGTIFQLLDRKADGCSDDNIDVSVIDMDRILTLVGFEEGGNIDFYKYGKAKTAKAIEEYQDILSKINLNVNTLSSNIVGGSIRIPPNLSILASMNTSDNSIYFMDSAFKRRWDWEFINWDDSKPEPATYGTGGELNAEEWKKLIKNLNEFIKNHHASIRGIEDKQIGYYFIKSPVTADKIQNKLMFFLWDSVFNRDKKPLVELLGVGRDRLVTFGDFTKLHNEFITAIMNHS